MHPNAKPYMPNGQVAWYLPLLVAWPSPNMADPNLDSMRPISHHPELELSATQKNRCLGNLKMMRKTSSIYIYIYLSSSWHTFRHVFWGLGRNQSPSRQITRKPITRTWNAKAPKDALVAAFNLQVSEPKTHKSGQYLNHPTIALICLTSKLP